MEIRPLSATFGAEITGVDLSRELDSATFSAIENAYAERAVLLFRDQKISDEQHVSFSRRLVTDRHKGAGDDRRNGASSG